jgi:hypothetical protein
MRLPTPASSGSNQSSPRKSVPSGRFCRRFCGIRFHAVISVGAIKPIRFEQTNWRLCHLSNSYHHLAVAFFSLLDETEAGSVLRRFSFLGNATYLIPPSLSVAALYCHSIGWIRLEQLVAFPYNRALRLTQLRSLLRSTAYSNGPRRIGYEFGRNAGSRVYLNRLKFVLIYDDFTYTLMKRGPPPHEQTNRLLCPGICHRT